jgi:predicted ATP-grasp superfamily ATP-dependent carboligase
MRFPVVVKPNVGGSGAGVTRFDTPETLAAAAHAGFLDLGLDSTALVQEFIPARDGRIVRVEVLNGKFLYGIRIYTPGDQFNLCPADVCQSLSGARLERSACAVDAPVNDLKVEGYEPPSDVQRAVEAITRAADIELGGVEYLIDERDGALYYYDVNALSNFVADASRVVGFDPFSRLVDWLEVELAGSARR